MEMRDIDFMWNGGETRRYHGFRMLMEDTVGHHSYNVACIIMKVRPDARVNLLRAALKHDMSEHIVGDMPAPSKRAAPDYVRYSNDHGPKRQIGRTTFREWFGGYEDTVADEAGVDLNEDLTEAEEWVLKFADSLDGMRFCINEMLLGNRTPRLISCYETFAGYVATLLWPGYENMNPIDMLHRDVALPATDADKKLYLAMTERAYNAKHGK